MKKIILLLFLFVSFAGTIIAQTDLTGIKIYVNPGHGGYDSDDRSVATIPFPTEWQNSDGFWESKSNLMKGLYLRDLLLAANATVMMSRITNTSADDRGLSTIVAEAHAFQPDGFLSIHSNANGTADNSTNYLLFLYSGTDAASFYPDSKPYATACWPFVIDNQLTSWSSTSTRIRGDADFYGTGQAYLGVLKNSDYRAFLSEGSFHDYKPETHRLLNQDYCNLEAYRYCQFFHSFFSRQMPNTGTIGGWVKSENEKMAHPLYGFRAGSPDQWKPLNGATVKLFDATGSTQLQTYTTDDWYNGIFAFYNLIPGSYKLKFDATDYDTDTVINVTVEAGKIAYAKVQLFNENIPVTHDYAEDYPEPVQDVAAAALGNYNFTEINKQLPAWLSDATTIKRAIYRNEKIYVLTTEPKIYVIDALTYALIRELDLTGITGGSHSILSDIAFTADNYLLACNKDDIALPAAAGQSFKVYTWDSDAAAPTLLFETSYQANWGVGTVGETFTASGPRWNVRIYTTAVTTGSSKQIRILALEYDDANPTSILMKFMGSADVAHNGAAIYTEAMWGEHPIFTISPSGDRDHIYLDSEILQPLEYQFDWSLPDRYPLTLKATFTEKSGYTIDNVARGGMYFRYAQHIFWAAPVCQTTKAQVGVVLFDVTDGLNQAVKISEKYPSAGLGATAATYMLAGAKVDGYDIELLIMAKNQGIARYKTQASTLAAIYASELAITANNEFQFTLNEDADDVIIKVIDNGTMTDIATFNTGALSKGTHVIEQDFSAIPNGTYSWSVTAKAAGIDRPSRISDNSQPLLFYSPRGVAVDNSFESPYFGRVYVSESAGGTIAVGSPSPTRTTQRGIYVLNAALRDTTNQQAASYAGGITWLTNNDTGYQYGPLRLSVAEDGKVYIPDSHYDNSGVWAMDAANPSANFTSVFSGTRNNATGEVNNGGTVIHNQIPSCYAVGSGAATELYILNRISAPVSATINRYDIGDLSTQWTSAPSGVISLATYMQNAYGTIAPDAQGGWFVSQYRGDASSGASVPSMIHLNSAGVIDYNSFNDKMPPDSINPKIDGSNRGGMAVSFDGTLLAIGTKPGLIKVFNVDYDMSGLPQLTLICELAAPGSSDQIHDLAFDVAGNLYLVSPTNERLVVYSLPKGDNSFTTPAPSNSNLTVNNILVDEANIYASELNVSTVDNVEYTFKYTLNAKASSLVINILDAGNAIVKTIPITSAANRTLGVHEFKANVTGLSVGTYKWEITATGAIRANSTTAPTKVSNDDLQFKFTDARSIAVDNSFDSPFFGRIYICDAQGTGAGSAGEGIYILNAALSDTTNQNGNGYKGGVAWVTTSSPFRASVAPDGNVYIADWSDAHTGVWKMDAANPTAPFTPVFGGTRDAGGLSSEGGVNIHGSISHCWVIDTGVNTKLYTFDEDYVDAAVIDKGSLLQYNIGNLSTPWAQAPSAVVYNDALYGNLQQNMNSCIVPDGIGGWWISQNRATNATNIPSLVHLNDQATLTNFGSNTNIVSSAQGGLAVSADGTQIAVGGQGIVKIFDVTFDVNNIPTLSLVYTISTSALGTNTHGLAFDNANNIYVAASANNTTLATRVGVWALPVANNSFTTPAPFTSVLEVIATAKPTVVSTTPANGETGVSISLNSVSVTFSQEINTGVTGTVQIINTTTSAVTGTVSSPIWSNNNTTVTFTYSGTLGYGVNYTIKVSDFENTTGNVMDDDATNSFTTIDLQLAVVSTTPANGTINVPVNLSEVSVIFNKEMDITTIGTVELVAGGVAVGTLSSPQWRTIDNKAITFTSTSTLDYATTYTINISGFKDNGGALMTGTNSDNSFTTETAPEVTLYVNKDYNAWLTHGKTFTLQQNGQVKYTGVDNLDGTVTFTAVVDGFYRLYDGANNLRDEVIQGVTSIGLSYYTIKFGLQNDGKASGSTINATYNDNAVSSGDVVISGRKLVLVAVGNGANRYTYTWRGSWNGNVNASITGDVLSVDIVDNIVDVHCTINGLGDEIILPKVVTPNMDGANDFFYVQGLEAYPSNELRIFNRSGTEVFRAKNYKNNTWSGSDLPDDVYFFSLGLIDENGALTTKTGYVHLKK